MGYLYEIKLANGDIITYESNKTLDELKQYIAENDFIKIPRNGTVLIKNGVRFVPKLASYQTKNITYIDHDIALEDYKKSNDELKKKEPLINQIFKYDFNKKMKRWLRWNVNSNVNNIVKEDLYFKSIDFLNKVLDKCKKYKCKLKEDKS